MKTLRLPDWSDHYCSVLLCHDFLASIISAGSRRRLIATRHSRCFMSMSYEVKGFSVDNPKA